MKKIILLLLIACLGWAESFAQSMDMPSTQGSEFYFSFMRGRNGRNKAMTLLVSSPENATVVLLNPQTGNTKTYSVTGGIVEEIDLMVVPTDNDAKENDSQPTVSNVTGDFKDCYTIVSNSPQDMGIYVKVHKPGDPTTPVKASLYASMAAKESFDVTGVYPLEALGNEYYVISRDGNNVNSSYWPSQALIVATEDATEIEIAPTSLMEGDGNDIKVPYTITLNRGQSYLLRAKYSNRSDNGGNDLTGTRIKVVDNGTGGSECKRIAVFSGTQHGSGENGAGTNGDYEFEQLFPMHLWGLNFMVATTITSSSDAPDVVRVVAGKPCTELTIKGHFYIGNESTPRTDYTTTINQSDFFEFRLKSSTDAAFITAAKSVEVALFPTRVLGNSNGAPSMIVIAPMEQYLNEITFAAAPGNGVNAHRMLVTSLTEICEQTTLNGNPFTGWTPIPSNPTYSTKTYTLSTGTSYTLKNDVAPKKGGFNAYIYGDGTKIGYGYSVGSAARVEMDLTVFGYTKDELAVLSCPPLGDAGIPFEPTGLENIAYSSLDWEIYKGVTVDANNEVTSDLDILTPIGRLTGLPEDGGKVNFAIDPNDIEPDIDYAVRMTVNFSGCPEFNPKNNVIIVPFQISELVDISSKDTILCKGSVIASERKGAEFGSFTDADLEYAWFSSTVRFTEEEIKAINADDVEKAKYQIGAVSNANALTLTDDYNTPEKTYWVVTKPVGYCKSIIDIYHVTTEPIKKAPVVQIETLCKGADITGTITDYKPLSDAGTTKNDFFGVPTYTWYSAYDASDINGIKTNGTTAAIIGTGTNNTNVYNVLDDYGTNNTKYYLLKEAGCAVLEEFDVSIDPIKTKDITSVLCKGSTIKEAVPSNYSDYGTTTNSFTGTPTYSWYKNFSGTDINQLIKEPTLTADVDGDNGEFYKPTEDFGKTATYYRLTEAGCAVADVIELTIEDIQSAADQKKTLCYDSSISGTVTDYSTYSTATPTKNNFTATPTYTWYKSFDKATQTGVLADDTNIGQTYKLPDADTYGTTVEYYVLAESGCAVLEKFVVDIEATKLTAETPLTECSGNTLTITPLTDYKPYSDATTPPNDFSGTPTYTWYKNVADLQDPQASEKVGDGANYLIPTSEEAGSEITYVRYSTAGCRVGEPFKVKIFDNVSNSVSVSSPAICADGKEVTITLHQEGGIDKWSYTINGIPGEYLADGTNDAVITFVPEADYRGTPTDYEIVLTSMSLCNGIGVTSSENVLAYHPLEVELYAEGSSLISDGKGDYLMPASGGVVSIIAKAYPEGDYNYTWNNPSFTNSAIQSNHAVDEEETYTVTVTDKAGLCSAAGVAVGDTELKIKVDEPPFVTLLIPGSPTNGTFGLKGMNSGNDLQQVYGGVSYTLTIFNRYGQVIEKLTGEDWDGTYKGKPADAGVYFYVLKYKTKAGNERERKGSVEILRK
jgi:gliding motility-associated-like protein